MASWRRAGGGGEGSNTNTNTNKLIIVVVGQPVSQRSKLADTLIMTD